MQNRHPVDRLHDVRVELKRLEAEEEKLRAYLLEHPSDRTGEEHIAVVGSQSRKRVDLKALADEISVSIGPTIKPVPAVKSERPGTCEPIGCRSDAWNFGILGRRYFSTKSFDARGGGPVHRGGGREDPER